MNDDNEYRSLDDATAPLDPRILSALRALYAPPSDEQFWDASEQRVMARVLGRSSTEWWQVLSGWAHTAAVAAAVAIILAGALLVTSEQSTPDAGYAAFESIADEPLAFSFDVQPPAPIRVNESPVLGVLPR